MGNTGKGCSVPASGHRYQLAAGTTLLSLVQKDNPRKSKKKKQLRAQRGWGHADTEQLPLRCQSPAEPRQPGAVFGFCAWPLPVLSPYLCVRQALLAAPSLSERARGERGGEEKGKALERMSRAGGGACVAPSSGMQLP